MVNTILAKRVNHIVAKGGNPVWPKGSKSRDFSSHIKTTDKITFKALIMRDYDTTISPLSDSQENSWFGLSFGL